MHWIHWEKLLVGFTLLIVCGNLRFIQGKVCRGTNSELHSRGNLDERYLNYKSTYTNCTHVEGNIEIVFLEDAKYDFTFLESIEEVSGYVLIVSCYSSFIPLTNLKVVRGQTLFSRDGADYSMYIGLNYQPNNSSNGLQELRFKNLAEIMVGQVMFDNNNLLCYDNTIEWDDILSPGGIVTFHENSEHYRRKCPPCDDACAVGINNARHCWGEGPDMCQKLSKVICSSQCDNRCYGREPRECCHKECAGGCTGPSNRDCVACKNFNNDGSCSSECDRLSIYNPKTYQLEPNPNAKYPYMYGAECVDKCPTHLVVHDAFCVQDCGPGQLVRNQHCVNCEGPCPKTCEIADRVVINSKTIVNFTDCTVIKGNLQIFRSTFSGDSFRNISALDPAKLSVLETVHEITGYVKIQGDDKNFKDLSFLRNLEKIQGRMLDNYGASLHVFSTSLESLNLQSLRQVNNGHILISKNAGLCFAKTIQWNLIKTDAGQKAVVMDNKDDASCRTERQVCHSQCSNAGCWGPGEYNCLSCANYHLANMCLQSCEPSLGIWDGGNRTCKPCHVECKNECGGPGPQDCVQCQNYKDGPYCVTQCPTSKYPDDNRVCQDCHLNCLGNCSGPRNLIGEGGCADCDIVILSENATVEQCLPINSRCLDGYYETRLPTGPMAHKKVCLECDPECRTCHGPLTTECQSCVNFEQDGMCVTNCSANYFADGATGQCMACDSQCIECRGASASECLSCKILKVYLEEEKKEMTAYSEDEHALDSQHAQIMQKFNCTDKCPETAPHRAEEKSKDGLSKQPVCLTAARMAELTGPEEVGTGLVVGLVIGSIVLVAVVVLLVFYFMNQRSKSEENKLRLTARMSGLEESEPLTPTDAKPDMATLRLIKESELRRGNIIGSGAFGTVYKGVWIPEGETVRIPVAIKVLQEGTSPDQNKELLEEARIMASVDHPCCIRILAVCMTAQMMLVTQLMPFGCLLDYCRKNKANIGSKALLNWCTQIARGMSYLEERAIVHRDLAARNVLVQNPGQIKITDFGLAKLLDYDEEVFHAGGGKMPIKWLALECIQHRVFTHKSDVWSFGVTIWELFTYGQRPYENVRARDIPDLLEKGERLPQPSMCTIDVYMIMIKCWMLDAESRPSFRELGDEFAKMARDPGRYLVITGDRYMRLPSCSYEAKDLLRNMSIAADTPEEFRVVEAEDYLQPRSVSIEPPSLPVNGKLERVNEDSLFDSDPLGNSPSSREGSRDRDYPIMGPPRPVNEAARKEWEANKPQAHRDYPSTGRREKKYSGLEAAAAARQQSRDSGTRYSSDPCKVLCDKEEEGGEGGVESPACPAPPTPIALVDGNPPGPDGAKINDFEVRLPVDEDDYLQPKFSKPRAYVDLVGSEQDYLASEPSSKAQPANYLDMSPGKTAIDNPEYFSSPGTTDFTNVNVDNLKTEKRPLHLPRMDSGESPAVQASEPDYINEYDKANQSRNAIVSESTVNPSVYIDPRTESMV